MNPDGIGRALATGLWLFWLMGESSPAALPSSPDPPRVFLLEGRHLAAMKRRVQSGDPALAPALARLTQDGEKALAAGPFTVVDHLVPPGGDRHDYMSQAPYFWANPDTANGLPYLRRDGERNPEINRFPDHRRMDELVEAVETLALLYYFRGEERHAVHAARLLRGWFLDPATRMNPHLQYAQAIPGVTTGRGIGLIETRGLTRVVDAAGLLAGAAAWTPVDQRGLEAWFARFLQWMRESRNGQEEAAARNNHGTYYDLQAAAFALFVGQRELARSLLESAATNRIARQIEPDGRQPLELARTRAWSYSVGNLAGLFTLARLGENVGVDLWHHATADGRSLRAALDYLLPFATGERKWPHQQLGEWSAEGFFSLLRPAARKYPDGPYRALLERRPPLDPSDRRQLLQPQLLPGPEPPQPHGTP